MSDTARIIVLRQVAALRRRGESGAAALERVRQSLPDGVVRDEVTGAARALNSGGPASGGDFTRVLAMPTAGPESADALADALEARLEANDAVATGRGFVQLGLATPLVTLALLGWLDLAPLVSSAPIPGATAVLLEASAALKWVGVPLAVLVVWLVGKLRWNLVPGAQAFTRAQRLLEVSTWAEPPGSLGGLGLGQLELAVVHGVGASSVSTGLRCLADELRREGRASVASFRLLAPVVFALVSGGFFFGVLAALYLPIFSIAGAIK